MGKYYTNYNYIIDKITRILDDLENFSILKNKKIAIFGVSTVTMAISGYLKTNISYFLDNNRTENTLDILGIPVLLPSELAEIESPNNLIILIASEHASEMKAQLLDLGIHEENIKIIINLKEFKNDYNFVNRENYTPMNNNEIKEKQLELLEYFKDICEKNDIWYTLGYGTLLGAVRHKGYIPWDDDIDVHILAEDIDRFIEAAESDTKQVVHLDNCCERFKPFPILIDTQTTRDIVSFPIPYSTGICIDIFPIFGVPSSSATTYRTQIKKMHLESWKKYLNKSEVHQSKELFYNYRKESSIQNRQHLAVTTTFLCNIEYWFDNKDLKELTTIEFEGNTYKSIANYDIYLKRIYGDYMSYPPISKRVSHHRYRTYKEPFK